MRSVGLHASSSRSALGLALLLSSDLGGRSSREGEVSGSHRGVLGPRHWVLVKGEAGHFDILHEITESPPTQCARARPNAYGGPFQGTQVPQGPFRAARLIASPSAIWALPVT